MPLSLFNARIFDLGMLTILVFYGGNTALFFVFVLYLQIGLGFSALAAGLTFVPLSLSFVLSSLLSPRLVPLFGTWVVRGGTIIMVLGELWTLLTVQQAGLVVQGQQLLAPFLVIGIGQGMILALLIPMILTGIQVHHAGAASGVLTTTMQIAGALGVAVIGIIFFAVLGKPSPVQPLHLAHTYGRAFVVSLLAIILLAGATLICIWLLSSTKQAKQDKQANTQSTKTKVSP